MIEKENILNQLLTCRPPHPIHGHHTLSHQAQGRIMSDLSDAAWAIAGEEVGSLFEVDYFGELKRDFEWKTYDFDTPANLRHSNDHR